MGFADFARSVRYGTSKKNRILKTVAAVAALLLLNAAISVPFIITGDIAEQPSVGLALRITGFVLTALWIASIIIARILKFETVLRGLFFYGLIGFLFFAVALAAKLLGGENAGGAVQAVFDWFSFSLRPLARLVNPLVGMSEFFGKALLFGMLTVSSGIAARSIIREKEFEKKMEENRKFEEESKKST